MSYLFRSLNNFSSKKENAIKEAIIETLTENSREIQYEIEQRGHECLELCESTSALCTTLEAIFLHGLKDSFLWQLNIIVAGDEERRPEPSFWAPLMVFLHKQVIEQIQGQTHITSEIGQCRAWIRLSLNESLLSSYLDNMRRNASALNHYYKKNALLKDAMGLEMAIKLLQSLEAHIQFNLPVNSSLLNQWPDYALQLSGLWTPPLKSCPISSGVDIAGAINAETASKAIPTPQPLRTNELFAESISNSPFSRAANFAADDELLQENLDVFLKKVDEMDVISEEESNAESAVIKKASSKQSKGKSKRKTKPGKIDVLAAASNEHENATDVNNTIPPTTPNAATGSNSLLNLMHTSWSTDTQNAEQATTSSCTTPTPSDDGFGSSRSSLRYRRSVSTVSFNDMLRKHEHNRNVDWTTVWEKFMLHNTATHSVTSDLASLTDDLDARDEENDLNCDFEFVPRSGLDKFDIDELQEMVQQLCKLAHESGLDVQGFLCKSCQHPLGIGYSEFRVCAFSGDYYCDSCMDVEPVLIPARIIFNWDFRKYHVSKRAAAFLAEFRCQPFLDLKLLNPDIYYACDAMAELQSLRIRLNFLRAYFYTCCSATTEEMRRLCFGKEYLYEHIHQYSISDLTMITHGALNQQLQKIYKMGEAHVLKCVLCSLKGFICEICNSSRVLYPFHLETTYRCETCGAVFHAECLNDKQPCPKCERKRKRAELPLLEAVENFAANA